MRPAECLTGLDLSNGWRVVEMLHRPETATGGKFSVGYLAKYTDGSEGYLKALDLSAVMQQPNLTRALEDMTSAYNFEKELLKRCQHRKLRRVVMPLADGEVEAPGNFGVLKRVPYLIFELASGDVRNEIAQWSHFDTAWSLRSLHQTAIGLRQLHDTGIAHQDLKPSNVLIFKAQGSKIADLGRASFRERVSPIDELPIPGDVGYSPPEQFYGWRPSEEFSVRFVADLYLLGSLVFFHFLRCSATQLIQFKLAQHRVLSQSNRFHEDLPYIQHAFVEALAELRVEAEKSAGDLADEVVMIAEQLCEPDPRRRGDPKARRSTFVQQHDLQPYISRFDRLARMAEARLL